MTTSLHIDLEAACERFVDWLERGVIAAGRGDELSSLTVEPSGLFWLGRLAPEDAVLSLGLGERGERLDPCACGIRLRLAPGPIRFTAEVQCRVWLREGGSWTKSRNAIVSVPIVIPLAAVGVHEFGEDRISRELAEVGAVVGRSAVLRVDVERVTEDETEVVVSVVNSSPEKHDDIQDLNLYEVRLVVEGAHWQPFVLEALPDSFRFDRSVPAYGINCGVELDERGSFVTTDTIGVKRFRPSYWNLAAGEPDLRFASLAADPFPQLQRLVDQHASWGALAWSDELLDQRARGEAWSDVMRQEAGSAAQAFAAETTRLSDGLAFLASDDRLLRSFRLMNEAMVHASRDRYDSWRPFQMGFLLANARSITDPSPDGGIADLVWFATGGGKTETYLGFLMTAAFNDRLRGKTSGMTAWSRFPLRMLSLQQTQRFADAFGAAELVRQKYRIPGDAYSIGFFVGQGATPNSIKVDPKDWEPDPDDDDMPAEFQVLMTCPFCHRASIEMAFNRRQWRLEHRCTNDACPWPERGLPFYIVDDEIYRFLPTVVVGTLDKAALIAMQAAMRGFVGAPHGMCSEQGHGYCYASRASRPNGCLVPGCPGSRNELPMAAELYPPSYRLQDELHLLRDSLGAVDSHYESLYDHLQQQIAGSRPKILASSATLAGYEKQVAVLYRREARVFPVQGPSESEGFWTAETGSLARRFVAIAPRGVTLEFTVDRMMTELQCLVRRLRDEPAVVCREVGIPDDFADDLLSLFGVDVLYGNNLRDLDAALRSLETQIPVSPLRTASLTGRTPFEDVRTALDSLTNPEDDFDDRLHVVAASSMMSHGVDIDRLNVMVMLGVPLSTAEFIQTTSRVGRRWPSIVFVVHKIARERDAGVYRSFPYFVRQGDRFVEPVPVTRRSRRVLERTAAGVELARTWMVHEPLARTALTTIPRLRDYCQDNGIDADSEFDVLSAALGFLDDLDEPVRNDLRLWLDQYFANLFYPAGTARFPAELSPSGPPMISLRDVEEQAPIRD